MHTLQTTEYSRNKNRAVSEISSQSTFPWLHMYGEGMYVFTQTLQTMENEDAYSEVELKTYLQ